MTDIDDLTNRATGNTPHIEELLQKAEKAAMLLDQALNAMTIDSHHSRKGVVLTAISLVDAVVPVVEARKGEDLLHRLHVRRCQDNVIKLVGTQLIMQIIQPTSIGEFRKDIWSLTQREVEHCKDAVLSADDLANGGDGTLRLADMGVRKNPLTF